MNSVLSFILFCSSIFIVKHIPGVNCNYNPDHSDHNVLNWDLNKSLYETRDGTVDRDINSKNCGITSKSRIVGGTEARIGAYPWLGAIVINGRPFCAGTIINSNFILTAAHCLRGIEYLVRRNSIKVFLGSHKFDGKTDPQSRVYEIDKIKLHSGYSDVEDDIALIKLKSKIKYTNRIRPICLPEAKTRTFTDSMATVAGWGRIQEGGDASDVLLNTQLRVISNGNCKTMYQNTNIGNKIVGKMLCTYMPKMDTCQGDSGGPVMLKNKNGPWSLIGIVSFGVGCARNGYPGVNTRVTQYIDWIKNSLKEM